MGDHRVPVRKSHTGTSAKKPQACDTRLTTMLTVVNIETRAQAKKIALTTPPSNPRMFRRQPGFEKPVRVCEPRRTAEFTVYL